MKECSGQCRSPPSFLHSTREILRIFSLALSRGLGRGNQPTPCVIGFSSERDSHSEPRLEPGEVPFLSKTYLLWEPRDVFSLFARRECANCFLSKFCRWLSCQTCEAEQFTGVSDCLVLSLTGVARIYRVLSLAYIYHMLLLSC